MYPFFSGGKIVKVDIKVLITIVTFAATMGGFYYSTQLRLNHLEENVASMEKQIKQLKKKKKARSQ